MVEYAIVLACIAAVGVYLYSQGTRAAANGLNNVLSNLWKKISISAGQTSSAGAGGGTNQQP